MPEVVERKFKGNKVKFDICRDEPSVSASVQLDEDPKHIELDASQVAAEAPDLQENYGIPRCKSSIDAKWSWTRFLQPRAREIQNQVVRSAVCDCSRRAVAMSPHS
jgi:hypothetical protein